MPEHARLIQCPVWFTQEWNDEFFDREGTFALFDAIGPLDKRLVAYSGSQWPGGSYAQLRLSTLGTLISGESCWMARVLLAERLSSFGKTTHRFFPAIIRSSRIKLDTQMARRLVWPSFDWSFTVW